jgi:hypothetical protein
MFLTRTDEFGHLCRALPQGARIPTMTDLPEEILAAISTPDRVERHVSEIAPD